MADGILYLDVDDEITSAAARVRAVESGRVAVVLPYGSRVATSRINFRLLARDALTHEKRLSVIASDSATRALAASAGLPVFASVQEYEASLPPPRTPADDPVKAAAAAAAAAATDPPASAAAVRKAKRAAAAGAAGGAAAKAGGASAASAGTARWRGRRRWSAGAAARRATRPPRSAPPTTAQVPPRLAGRRPRRPGRRSRPSRTPMPRRAPPLPLGWRPRRRHEALARSRATRRRRPSRCVARPCRSPRHVAGTGGRHSSPVSASWLSPCSSGSSGPTCSCRRRISSSPRSRRRWGRSS